MRKLLSQAKSLAKEHIPSPSQSPSIAPHPGAPQADQPARLRPPTIHDLYRYRYHHGTNIGSVFCLEKWLVPSMYPSSCAGSSELSAVSASIAESGLPHTREKFQRHWAEYVSDDDLDWLVSEGGCNSVRLPIGYWSLGPRFCKGTAFEKVSDVYVGAWEAVRRMIWRCQEKGIGVLVDMHGLPGGANGNDHSGTDSGKVEFWSSRRNLDLGLRCVEFVAMELRGWENLIGLQIVNETQGGKAGEMWTFYDMAREVVRRIDETLPIYVSDAWELGRAVAEVGSRNRVGARGPPLVLDTHLYWCFTSDDHKKTVRQISGEVYGKLGEVEGAAGDVLSRGAVQAIIGEYSCALNPETWGKSGHEGPRDDLGREYGQAQSTRYQSKAGGSFFWTYRMDWMDGGEWGFKEQTKKGAITAPSNLRMGKDDIYERIRRARESMYHKRGNTYGTHCQYWDSNHPGYYEHQRFETGWTVGFEDALNFFEMRIRAGRPHGGDKIGMLDLWVLKRLRESGQGGKFAWEYEQGLRQGVRDFYELAGI